MMEEKKAWCE